MQLCFLHNEQWNAYLKVQLIETKLYFMDLSICATFLDKLAITDCFIAAGIDLKVCDV